MEGSAPSTRKRKAEKPPETQSISQATTTHPYCVALELLALMLHRGARGDNQSTTTLCFLPSNSTLYITSQMDSISFPDFTGDRVNIFGTLQKVKGNEDILQKLAGYAKSLIEAKDRIGDFLREFDLVQEEVKGGKVAVGRAKRRNSARKSIARTVEENLDRLDPGHLLALIQKINAFKIITNCDIFILDDYRATGLHGESRIMRFFFIKFFARELRLVPASEEENREKLTGFREVIRPMQPYFGSSQATCPECCDFLDDMKAYHGARRATRGDSVVANKSRLWTNPITGVGRHTETGKAIQRITPFEKVAEHRAEIAKANQGDKA